MRPLVTSRRTTRAALAALLLALAGLAAAGAGRLGPGDTQLSTGEYFDRVTFDAAAGDTVVVELTSTEFDPYLIVVDANDQPIFQEDDSPGAGLNVYATVTLPAAGRYSVIVTSAYPNETGAYRLTISAAGAGAAQVPTAPTPQPPVNQPPTPQPMPPSRPGTVTGTVVDTQGRPIAGARVWIQPSITTGLVEVRTDANGRYLAQGLVDVPYTAKAWTYVTYNGRQLCLRLGMGSPADYDSFVATQGAVRDFRWQLTGPIEDLRNLNEYFGGMLRVMSAGYYSGSRIEFSFTPTGPRVDGSSVAPFTRVLNEPGRDIDIYDLPVGPYRVAATLISPDGSRRPLRLARDGFAPASDAVDIDWTGDGTCSNQSGVDWAYVWVEIPD
jgi:hypothetical protein